MIHFLYLVAFGALVGTAFAVFSKGDLRQRVLYGLKSFGQFVFVSLALAWLLYFIPW